MKLSLKQGLEITRFILDSNNINYDEDSLKDFVTDSLINKEFSEV